MDIFLTFLSKTLNMDTESIRTMLYKKGDDGEFTTDFNDNALDALLTNDATRIEGIKGKSKEQFDNGYKKAQAEVAAKIEGDIRKRSGITDTTLIGSALLDAAFTPKDESTTEDKVKRHPLYINLEKMLTEREAELLKEKEEAVMAVKTEFQQTQTRQTAQQQAKQVLLGLKPILPADQSKAEAQLNLFLSNALNGIGFDTDESGKIIGLTKDGSRYEDTHGHAYTLERLVKEAAGNVYDFHAQDPKASAGNKNEPPPPGAPPVNLPKTMAEFQALPMDKQIELASAFAQAQKAQQ